MSDSTVAREAREAKKLALKAASLKEKERESQFVAKLYQCVARATPDRERDREGARAPARAPPRCPGHSLVSSRAR